MTRDEAAGLVGRGRFFESKGDLVDRIMELAAKVVVKRLPATARSP